MSESGGIVSSIWRDSGIRLQRSAVTSTTYGIDTTRFGSDFSRVTWNRNTDDNNEIATDKLPLVTGAKISYQGELGEDMWISLVDDSLADPDGSGDSIGNPCVYGGFAAGAASEGSTDARPASGAIKALELALTSSLA